MLVKLLPYTSKAQLDIGDAVEMDFTPAGRALGPYPPGKVQVNGQYWPDGCTFHGDVTLTWAHRNAYAQEARDIVRQDAASVAAGQVGTYTIEVLINGVVARTVADLETNSFVYTLAECTADGGAGQWIQFRITPVLGANVGNPRTTDQFMMAA